MHIVLTAFIILFIVHLGAVFAKARANRPDYRFRSPQDQANETKRLLDAARAARQYRKGGM